MRLVGTVENHAAALPLIHEPGDVAIVKRGVFRSLIMHCPDGCGEVITVNLDPRTTKAWRIYINKKGLTLYPSVWRDTGCESHFVLWNSVFHWMDSHDLTEDDPEEEERLDRLVLPQIGKEPSHYVDIADKLGEIPWAVLESCRRLVKAGRAVVVDDDEVIFALK
ncbi:MAG: hypothetical protein JSS48_08440 [Nitrospira sp.]|nr:hypothetical protein [Nitrospira sp.]